MIHGYSPSDEERWVSEELKSASRTAFARDRARVLHSAGLRRLAAKTQVLVAGELDFPRTRLTHTLEVAQIGRELGTALGCDPDLVDVAGLAHDLGHPPFGHNGEEALDGICADIGGFEGNAQTLRVLTRLEAKVVDSAGRSVGLNLTRAALDASCKYPWPRHSGTRKFGVYEDDLPVFEWLRRGSIGTRTCIESQVMDWADDVAYSVHDLEDAVVGGHFDLRSFHAPTEVESLVVLAHTTYAPDLHPDRLREAALRIAALPWLPASFSGSHSDLVALKDLTSRLIGRFCSAAEMATLAEFPQSPLTRYAANLIVPDDARSEVAILKAVTARHVMFRDGAGAQYAEQRALLTDLVSAVQRSHGTALEPWLRPTYEVAITDAQKLRVTVDQVASLTDVSAVVWHVRLCS
ncbi:MAG: deoxyguanosinetriphosphate triphosphohydrolase [Actinobacteria bacterium]|nr:deoxyguanosinetriphosphate triphosphohydrolase [Actinomycetota bacterium]